MTTPLTISLNYGIDRMSVGTTCIATAKIGNVALTSGVNWKVVPEGAATVSNELGKARVIARFEGPFVLVCIAERQAAASLGFVLPPSVTPTPPPPPPPTIDYSKAPALNFKRVRDDIQVWATNFYYNITPAMYDEIARRFDVLIGHADIIPEELKRNPNLIYGPYTLQYTTIKNGSSLESGYMGDLLTWAAAKGLNPNQIDSMFLKNPDGTRLVVVIWGSERWVGDPRDANWCAYQLDRYKRIAKWPNVELIFVDEFGSNQINANFKKGAADSAALAAIISAETALMDSIKKAVFPVQMVVNTAAYMFQNDIDIAKAALGIHMEQINNPMNLDWWNTSWPYIDKLLAANVLVNITSPYLFGEYESTKDSKGVHMDTPRGKLLELAAYYMCVTNPALLAFHVENGDWDKDTIIQNWIGQIDGKFGRAIEPRQKQPGLHVLQRRFENGLVIVNPIADRLAPDFGTKTTIVLPNDRKYGLLNADLTVGPQINSIELRCPEAAFFKVIP